MTNNESLLNLSRRLNGAQRLALTGQTRRTLAGTLRSNTQSELTAASLRAEGLLNADNTLTERGETLRELLALLS
jgi:hypothetical protein